MHVNRYIIEPSKWLSAPGLYPKTMSRTPNFETIVMSSILLEAYFREHSINVTIVSIGCQMAEISAITAPSKITRIAN